MKTVKSASTVKPAQWDTTSSPTTVYRNTDIAEIPAASGSSARYAYTQEQYSRQEYETLVSAGYFRKEELVAQYEAALAEIEEALGVSQ